MYEFILQMNIVVMDIIKIVTKFAPVKGENGSCRFLLMRFVISCEKC